MKLLSIIYINPFKKNNPLKIFLWGVPNLTQLKYTLFYFICQINNLSRVKSYFSRELIPLTNVPNSIFPFGKEY
jgi:hypothetical protein